MRLRDHAGIGMANALTALKSGARSFDATLGGIDGTLAAEDLLYLCELLEVAHRRRPRRRAARRRASSSSAWGEPLPSRTRDVADPGTA